MNTPSYLAKIRQEQIQDYPFKHLIISDFIKKTDLIELELDVKRLELTSESNNFQSDYGVKREWRKFPPELTSLNAFIDFLHSAEFISTLQHKFQLPNAFTISPDKSFDGGGYVISPPNSYLGYHADFNLSSQTEKYRILNVLF